MRTKRTRVIAVIVAGMSFTGMGLITGEAHGIECNDGARGNWADVDSNLSSLDAPPSTQQDGPISTPLAYVDDAPEGHGTPYPSRVTCKVAQAEDAVQAQTQPTADPVLDDQGTLVTTERMVFSTIDTLAADTAATMECLRGSVPDVGLTTACVT